MSYRRIGGAFLFFFLFAGSAIADQQCVNNSSCSFHFPRSSERYLTEADLYGLSSRTLWEARNEIFARNGYIFSGARGRAYFGGKAYYRAQTKQVSLNKYERHNVEFIKSVEEGRRTLKPPHSIPPNAYALVKGLNPLGDNFLALRSGASSEASMIGKLYEGQRVKILSQHGNWYLLQTERGSGWAYGDWLIAAGSPDGTPDQESASVAEQVRQPSVEVHLSGEAKQTIEQSQDAIAQLTAQIALLTEMLRQQQQTSDSGRSQSSSAMIIGVLQQRLSTLESRMEEPRQLLRRYQTPVRPQNADRYEGLRRLSEAFPKVPYYRPGEKVEGEMWIEPKVRDDGHLVFLLSFVDPEAEYESVSERIELSLDQIHQLRDGLLKVQEWHTTAKKNAIRRHFEKEASCFPDDACNSREEGNSSTSVTFEISEDGSTSAHIIRNKGIYRQSYGYSIESASLLVAYIDFLTKESKKEYESGTMTESDLKSIFN